MATIGSSQLNGSHRRLSVREPNVLRESPGDANDLADYFGVMPVAQSFRAVVAVDIGVKDERAVLQTTKCAHIGSVPPEQQIERLLPKRSRLPVDRRLFAPIYDGQESAVQVDG